MVRARHTLCVEGRGWEGWEALAVGRESRPSPPLAADDHSILLENLIDPAHLPVSHHGLGTLDRAKAKPVPMRRREVDAADPSSPTLDFDIASVMSPLDSIDPTSRLSFHAPTHVRYRYRFGGARIASTCLYATPTSPGRARVFLADAAYTDPDYVPGVAPKELPKPPISFGTKVKMIKLALRFKFSPRFVAHWAQSFIFDSDGVLLHGQMRRLAASIARGVGWRKAYYVPSSCDRFVGALRAWIDDVAGGGPQWVPGATPAPTAPLARAVALDRGAQHTALCPVCQKGERQITLFRDALIVACVGACVAAAAAAGRGAALAARNGPLPWLVAAAAAARLAAWAHLTLLPEFGFKDHVHADND